MERLTSRQLRARAAESGYKLSGARFNDLREWGLIPEPGVDGCWSEDIADRLVRIGALGRSIRSMPRRVILLRKEGVPVPPAKIQEAMCNVIPTISQPVSKMKRSMKARKLLGGPETEKLTVRERRKRERDAWKPPDPDQWIPVVRSASLDDIDRHFGICLMAAAYSRSLLEMYRDVSEHISDIPMEELITLFMVQNVAVAAEEWERVPESAKRAATSRQ
jgi:hypothetical protein